MPLTRQLLAERLLAARKACGLSQAEVAEALGVTRPVVSLLESGDRKVSSVELWKLARLYGRLPGELLGEEFDPEESLLTAFRAVGTAEADVEAQREAVRHCREIAAETRLLERVLGIPRAFDGAALALRAAQPPETVWQALQQGERAAVEERRRLGLGSAPAPDLVDLLEAQGILTTQLDLPEGVDGLTLMLADGPVIAVNRGERLLPRRRFSLAHEYAHVLLDGGMRASVTHRQHQDDIREKRANRFAAAFLLPEAGVSEMLTSLGKPPRENTSSVMAGDEVYATRNTAPASESEIQPHDVVQLGRYFGASHQAVLYRLLSLGYLAKCNFDALIEAHRSLALSRLAAALLADAAPPSSSTNDPDRFRHRYVSLILEALRRDEISWGRAHNMATLAGMDTDAFDDLAKAAGLERWEVPGRIRRDWR